jgi:CDP-4-dehydro-6-deoxyglucose reductase, E1
VLVDVDPNTLSLSGSFEEPVLAIHMLGNPAQVETPWLLEDSCGAHGAEINGQKTGSIGKCGAFSFFFSHHITTGEGGAITTNDPQLADACRSIRAHGWVRERNDRQKWEDAHPHIDPRFLFASMGYNLRMTEISGAIGMHQVDRIEGFVQQRRANHQVWCEMVEALSLPLKVYPESPNTRHAGFAFPMMLSENAPIGRAALCAELEKRHIQTRPISGANLTIQPAFSKVPNTKIRGRLTVATAVQERGFFVGQSHAFTVAHGELLCRALSEIFAR